METEKKNWRTKSQYSARNVRIMSIDEPKQINDELTLCSFSFLDQPGDDKGSDTWVRVTGANGLAERIFNSSVGDRVNVFGKPSFRAYINKEGVAVAAVEVKYPDIDFLTPLNKTGTLTDNPETKVDESHPPVVVVSDDVEKRRPGRPKKLPFQS